MKTVTAPQHAETLPPAMTAPITLVRVGSAGMVFFPGEVMSETAISLKAGAKDALAVCGYANDMAAYIPSRRVWEEGGYEGGPHLDEYGRPAWRWQQFLTGQWLMPKAYPIGVGILTWYGWKSIV